MYLYILSAFYWAPVLWKVSLMMFPMIIVSILVSFNALFWLSAQPLGKSLTAFKAWMKTFKSELNVKESQFLCYEFYVLCCMFSMLTN